MFAPVSAAGPVGAGVRTHSALFQHVRQTRSDCVWPPLAPAGRQCRCQTGTVKVVTLHGDAPVPDALPLVLYFMAINTSELLFCLAIPSCHPQGAPLPCQLFLLRSWRHFHLFLTNSSPQAQFPSNGVTSRGARRCRSTAGAGSRRPR